MLTSRAKFRLGQMVRHRSQPIRGVVFDIDPSFAPPEDWVRVPDGEARRRRDQPFYHLLAEGEFVAYVSEQNLLPDTSGRPVRHPDLQEILGPPRDGIYPIDIRIN